MTANKNTVREQRVKFSGFKTFTFFSVPALAVWHPPPPQLAEYIYSKALNLQNLEVFSIFLVLSSERTKADVLTIIQRHFAHSLHNITATKILSMTWRQDDVPLRERQLKATPYWHLNAWVHACEVLNLYRKIFTRFSRQTRSTVTSHTTARCPGNFSSGFCSLGYDLIFRKYRFWPSTCTYVKGQILVIPYATGF